MNIVVCVKQVPDTATERKLRSDDNTLDRDAADGVVNELDEYAVEEALKIKERPQGGECDRPDHGPGKATDTIRKALAMGADKAVHPQRRRAARLRRAVHLVRDGPGAQEDRFDLVILGSESTERAHRCAGRRCWPSGSARPSSRWPTRVEVGQGAITIQRLTDYGYDLVEAPLPAVVSVVEKINEPRYPSFKGIMAAKKKPVETLAIGDASIDAAQVGLAAAWSEVVDFAAAPPRAAGTIVKDEGDGGEKAADFLASKKFI
ncbi:electron transfer flavoprotein subunit beta/FixA family protein [Nonomuraea rubra]|uniref:electron transfer flavoprotein subunit beta/FixA family protein n=1 Tax=Nonomuraea rubra TaxID=46180 RepID=UPI0031EF5F1F